MSCKLNITLHEPTRLGVQMAGSSTLGIQMRTPTAQAANGLPPSGNTGDVLMKKSNADYDVEWVTPADMAEQDNTRPITSAAVYTEIGNINALLATI